MRDSLTYQLMISASQNSCTGYGGDIYAWTDTAQHEALSHAQNKLCMSWLNIVGLWFLLDPLYG